MFLFLFEGAAPLLQRSFKIHVFLSKIIYDGARRTIVIALASFIGFKDWICLHVLYNESLRFKNIRIPFKSFFFDQKKKFILFNWIYFSRSLFFCDNEKIGKEKFAQPRLQLNFWFEYLISYRVLNYCAKWSDLRSGWQVKIRKYIHGLWKSETLLDYFLVVKLVCFFMFNSDKYVILSWTRLFSNVFTFHLVFV